MCSYFCCREYVHESYTPLFEITSIDASVASPQKLGTTITLDGTVNNVGYPYPHGGYTFNFSITKGGVETASLTSFGGSGTTADWTPTEPGKYVITATTASQYNMATATNGANYSVGSGSILLSRLTIIYSKLLKCYNNVVFDWRLKR